jgi:hypothetical protein
VGEGQILEYVLVAVILTRIKIESDTIKQFFDRARVGLFNRDFHRDDLPSVAGRTVDLCCTELLLGQCAAPLKSEKMEMPWFRSTFNCGFEKQQRAIQQMNYVA